LRQEVKANTLLPRNSAAERESSVKGRKIKSLNGKKTGPNDRMGGVV